MSINYNLKCCAFVEYEGFEHVLWSPEKAIKEIAEEGQFNFDSGRLPKCSTFAFVLLSAAWNGDNGIVQKGKLEQFIEFVKKHKLGSVNTVRARVNPNMENKTTVKPAIYSVSQSGLNQWCRENEFTVKDPEAGGWDILRCSL